jgi:precorrin-6Y C5,15-methyltransferase (decarboxylating)
MITKAEVRCLALARLGPGVGDLVWDVGAGTGSVAIECARFGAAAVAIERDPVACERIARNAARHGVPVQVVCGEAPEALDPLPDPDCVYVGGTGRRFSEVLKGVSARVRRAAVVGLAGLQRVTPAAELLAEGGLAVETTLVQAARLEGIGDASRLAPINPVFLVSGVRR